MTIRGPRPGVAGETLVQMKQISAALDPHRGAGTDRRGSRQAADRLRCDRRPLRQRRRGPVVDARARARRRLDGRGESGPGGGLDQVSMIITPFMGRSCSPGRRGARRDAPWIPGTSVKRRNDPRGQIRATEGRPQRPSRLPLWVHGAACLWCPTPGRETAPGANAWRCFRRRSTASNP